MTEEYRDYSDGLSLPRVHRSMGFVWFLTYSCRAFIDPWGLCGSSRTLAKPS